MMKIEFKSRKVEKLQRFLAISRKFERHNQKFKIRANIFECSENHGAN